MTVRVHTKPDERSRKRLESVSSQVYAHLIHAGDHGVTPVGMAGAANKGRNTARSHMSVLVTEGLAERVGRSRWRAIIPVKKQV